tara:strand:- start:245 stop:601 length:357 start_codon:yes stop_codon:yes gene_type:complete
MKKAFFIATFLLLSSNIFSQQNINVDDLIGYWQSKSDGVRLFLWKDRDGKLQAQELLDTGEIVDIVDLKLNGASLFIKETFIPNNWTTLNTFTFVDKKTLKCKIIGNGAGIIMYTKIK